MQREVEIPLPKQIASDAAIWLISLLVGLLVFAFAIFIQWLIYDDWLHDRGPVRIVGSFLAGVLMFLSIWRWRSW